MHDHDLDQLSPAVVTATKGMDKATLLRLVECLCRESLIRESGLARVAQQVRRDALQRKSEACWEAYQQLSAAIDADYPDGIPAASTPDDTSKPVDYLVRRTLANAKADESFALHQQLMATYEALPIATQGTAA